MIQQHATPEDFQRWETRARLMSVSELRYAAEDCRKAEAAMRGWNPVREGESGEGVGDHTPEGSPLASSSQGVLH